MSAQLYEIIVYLVEALISGIFLINMLEAKFHKALHVILWCAIVALAIFFTPAFSILRIGVIAGCELIYTYLMFEDKPWKKIRIFLYKELLMVAASMSAFSLHKRTQVDRVFLDRWYAGRYRLR